MNFLSIKDAADFMGVNRRTLHKWLLKGQIEPSMTTAGGQKRFSERDLREFLKGRRPSPNKIVIEIELTDDEIVDHDRAEELVKGLAEAKAVAALRELLGQQTDTTWPRPDYVPLGEK